MNQTGGGGGVLPAKRMEINDDVTQIFPPSTWRFIRVLPRAPREGTGEWRA